MHHFSCANSMASMHSQLGFVDLVGNGKRLREASGVDLVQDEADCSEPPSRRGARASYYRPAALSTLPSVPSAESLTDLDSEQPRQPREQPHARLLDACEEGDVDALKACLQQPGVDSYLNLAGWARGVTPKAHPEALAWGRGETCLRVAAFHGHRKVVKLLLEAGAVPSLRNDEAKNAQQLSEVGSQLLAKRHRVADEDLPRVQDQKERDETWWLLKAAMAQQWIVRDSLVAGLDGRIAQIVNVSACKCFLCETVLHASWAMSALPLPPAPFPPLVSPCRPLRPMRRLARTAAASQSSKTRRLHPAGALTPRRESSNAHLANSCAWETSLTTVRTSPSAPIPQGLL